jgi:hypothetical protein
MTFLANENTRCIQIFFKDIGFKETTQDSSKNWVESVKANFFKTYCCQCDRIKMAPTSSTKSRRFSSYLLHPPIPSTFRAGIPEFKIVTVTGSSLEEQGSNPAGITFISLYHYVKTSFGVHTAPYPEGHEADYTSLSSVELKSEWSCICTSPYLFAPRWWSLGTMLLLP